MAQKKISNNQKRKLKQLIATAKDHVSASNFPTAEQLCQDILKIDANNADAYNLLGIIAVDLKQIDAAESLFKQATQLNAKRPEFWNNLGLLYEQQESTEEALNCFNKSLSLDAKQIEIYGNKAIALEKNERFLEALETLKQALKLQPNNAGLNWHLGTLLAQGGELEMAKLALHHTLELNPKHPLAHHNIASIAYQMGDFDTAEEYARRSLNISPKSANSYAILANIKRLTAEDIHTAKALYENKTLEKEVQENLAFILAKVFESQKEYSQSFRYLVEGNNAVRSTSAYDISHDHTTFQQIKSVFTHDFIRQQKHLETTNISPIFIVGMPRSGTSLAEQIITSHPNVYGIGEADCMLLVFRYLCQDQDDDEKQSVTQIPRAPNERWLEGQQCYLNFLKSFSDANQAQHYTDKTPTNYFLIGLIHMLFPHARIIHCSRNPVDNCLSIYKEKFAGYLHKYAYNLDEMAEFYLLYQDLMQYWTTVLPEGVMYELKYENLIEDQQGETAKLLEHCQLDWHDDCLNFYQSKRTVSTASAAQVRKPLYKTSVEGWRRYEEQLMPLAKKLGYA